MASETITGIVAEMRGMGNYQQYSGDHARQLADRIEAAAKRAYNAIDSVVCGIEDASHYDIDDVRKAMDETIGDYYE